MKLNHNSQSLGQAFNLSDEQQNKITATIFYEIIDSNMKIEELFDSPDEAPRELTTLSGTMEACLNRVTTASEKLYTVWELGKIDNLKNTDNEKDSAHFMQLMAVTTMMYMSCNKDYEKFVQKFSKGIQGARDKFMGGGDI